MNAAVNLFKPSGITSQRAVSIVKRLVKACKAGHMGTLDPMAEGVLPILLDRATKAQDMTDADKRYIARFKLGITTDTQDITGNILQRSEVKATRAHVERALNSFVGRYMQTPPMYSALKKDGRKLYELARAGVEVEREPRQVEIYSAALIYADEAAGEYGIDVHCSKGTYIRALCDDIGKALGCGAAMTYLCRTKAGVFEIESAVTIDELENLASEGKIQSALVSVERLFEHLPILRLSPRQERLISNGVRLNADAERLDADRGGTYRLYGKDGFLGVGQCAANNGQKLIVMMANFKEV